MKADTPRVDLPPFTADPHNDKLIVVKGWNEAELRRIVDDFVTPDTFGSQPRIEIRKRLEREFGLTFPDDIPAFDCLALLNYLNYPIDFDIGGRSIAAIGKATLTSDFQGISQSLVGKKAVFYVPENDTDYDVVFLRAETGQTLKYSLSEQVWQPANDARLSPEVTMLG